MGKSGRTPQQMEQDSRAVQQHAGEQVARPTQSWTEQVGQQVPDQAHLVGLGIASTIGVKCQDQENRQGRICDSDHLTTKGALLWLRPTPHRHCFLSSSITFP